MTRRLRTLFPGAKIGAVEVNPVFARRWRARLGQAPDIDIVEASAQGVPLSADLVCLAEVVYLIPDHYMDLLGRLKARYLLTSYVGDFDDRVSACLRRFGWRNSYPNKFSQGSKRWMVPPAFSSSGGPGVISGSGD